MRARACLCMLMHAYNTIVLDCCVNLAEPDLNLSGLNVSENGYLLSLSQKLLFLCSLYSRYSNIRYSADFSKCILRNFDAILNYYSYLNWRISKFLTAT